MLTLDPDYAWCLFIATVMCLQCALQGLPVGGARRKIFNAKFFEKNFPNLKVARGGYPDNGNGVYAAKLPYEDWLLINNAQRCHLNYVEGLAPAVVFELVSGLFNTRWAVIAGIAYIVGRMLYSVGYKAKGASGRFFGLIFIDLSLLFMVGFSLYSCFKAGGGFAGLVALVTNA